MAFALGATACAGNGGFGRPEAGVTDGGGTDASVREASVLPEDDAGPLPDARPECQKIDLLFVIDDSASMDDNQRSLAASVPGFLRAMKTRLRFADSFHVGVVTSDAYRFNAAGCQSIGDLVTQTGGLRSSNRVCGPFASGLRWLDGNDPNLDDAFTCAAQLGVLGDDDEKMARALLNATTPARNGPGQCNDGFLRRDSLLVVTLITDEDDVPEGCDSLDPPTNCMTYGSGGTPAEWFSELSRNRNGTSQNIAMLGLFGRRADNPCGAVVNSKLLGLVRRFGDFGLAGDICASSYDSFFNDALAVVENACRAYVPPL